MEVLKTILEMINCKYDVKAIRGNHDDMLLRTILNCHDNHSEIYFEMWGRHAFKKYWGNLKKSEFQKLVETQDPRVFPIDCLKLLESMPYLIVEDDYVFVHAGLDTSLNDPINDTDIDGLLWSRKVIQDSSKLSGKQIVSGHNIKDLNTIRKSIESSHILLDNGAFTKAQPEKGNLVALNLDTKELILQPWCDGDVRGRDVRGRREGT